jgi:mediator of replication checkpoint protein 1
MSSTSPQSSRSTPLSRSTDASKPRPKLLAALRKSAADSSDSETESENSASASEDDTQSAPARAISPKSPSPGLDEEEEIDDGKAYERMKARLAASKKSIEPSLEQDKPVPAISAVVSSEDEDDMPVQVKVRTLNTRRSTTASPRVSLSPRIASRHSSPGLFVTPDVSPAKNSRARSNAGSESDESSNPIRGSNFQDRVRRIRAERLAREQAEAEQEKAKKAARPQADRGSGDDSDGENSRRLTQQAKPTRKAGKKALEAMARDQQRISRNMQLTHQAKTKKRFTTMDLFAKMGYNAPGNGAKTLPTPEASSALASSDGEVNQTHDTPPQSPSHHNGLQEDMSSSLAVEAPALTKEDKGKGRALDSHEPLITHNAAIPTEQTADSAMVELSDSEDDVKVAQPKSRFPVFDRLPKKKEVESTSLHHLRALAQLIKSPPRARKGEKSSNRAEWESSLAQKARQQANQAREAKLADLIARGVYVETEEEREKRQEEIDDMVAQFEKQRQEDQKLAKIERQEAKDNGEVLDDLPSSDEDDGDYVGSGEENAQYEDDEAEAEADVEYSGSEDEDVADEEEEAGSPNGLIDEMAEEDEESNEQRQQEPVEENADMEDEEAVVPTRQQPIKRARRRVIVDEDDNDIEAQKPASPTQPATQGNAMAAFGFGNAAPGLGLTQMFAGTMADLASDSQSQSALEPGHETEQNSLDFLRSLPGTMMRGSSRSSETEVCTSASVIGLRVRLSEAAVRRMFGGGRFSFCDEEGDLRLRGLMGAGMAAVSAAWESGMTSSIPSTAGTSS